MISGLEAERRDILSWLKNTDPSPLYHGARENYEPGTGDWLLRSQEWKDWVGTRPRCLWIHGIPGAGKTMLLSHAIESITEYCAQQSQRCSACVYYYCYFGHKQDETQAFLAWLVGQLCRQADFVPPRLSKERSLGHAPSNAVYLSALADICKYFERIYVVLDAIDESQQPWDGLLSVLESLVTDVRFEKIQTLASSREYWEIEITMNQIALPVSMANPHVEADIRLRVRALLKNKRHFGHYSNHLLSFAEDCITTGAQGMYVPTSVSMIL